MDWNDWKAAGRQLMAHWQRSGVNRIPRPSNESSAQAKAWMDTYADVLVDGPSASSTSTAVPTSLPGRSEPTTPQPITPRQTVGTASTQQQVASAARPATPSPQPVPQPSSPHQPASLPNLASGDAAHWVTESLAIDDRNAAFARLNEQVVACRKCADIVCRRQRTVFGVGPVNAKLVMFGEAPGADEDRVGEPFVGAAGQLLDKILVASGLHRNQVYILNALRCRPPGNRTPTDEEIENCRPFFEAQLETIQPEYIVCWGAVAVRAVLKSTESVGRLRGRFHKYRGAKVLVTYHPAYLLRNPNAKRSTWEDMQLLMRELGIPIPNRN